MYLLLEVKKLRIYQLFKIRKSNENLIESKGLSG